jgi:hypothetical protein
MAGVITIPPKHMINRNHDGSRASSLSTIATPRQAPTGPPRSRISVQTARSFCSAAFFISVSLYFSPHPLAVYFTHQNRFCPSLVLSDISVIHFPRSFGAVYSAFRGRSSSTTVASKCSSLRYSSKCLVIFGRKRDATTSAASTGDSRRAAASTKCRIDYTASSNICCIQAKDLAHQQHPHPVTDPPHLLLSMLPLSCSFEQRLHYT